MNAVGNGGALFSFLAFLPDGELERGNLNQESIPAPVEIILEEKRPNEKINYISEDIPQQERNSGPSKIMHTKGDMSLRRDSNGRRK
ncbi:unnamed protein product [Allacma fusca]|uniref:Uncharacterized protein n=1 Tax=Allacma fusca TaxID=39272 RepID=A0A8J2KEB3_9HEXA|nr:unnamed protein product [Allacma fusca]